MIFYELRTNEGSIVAGNLAECPHLPAFAGKEHADVESGGIRNMVRSSDAGTVRIIAPHNHELVVSAKIRERSANAFLAILPSIQTLKRDEEVRYTILSHNLTTTHKRLRDEIDAIIPASTLARCKNYNDQIDMVRRQIKKMNPDDVAAGVLQLAKRVSDLSAQIEGFEMLKGESATDFDMYNMRNVLLNFVYPFYDELNAKRIRLTIRIEHDFAEQHRVPLHYGFFNVAMHHFLNNIVKYARPDSIVNVDMLETPLQLKFSMKSIRIDNDELQKIFELEYSGRHVDDLGGEGVGMFMVKKSLEMLGGTMRIAANYASEESYDGRRYVDNTFVLFLPESTRSSMMVTPRKIVV